LILFSKTNKGINLIDKACKVASGVRDIIRLTFSVTGESVVVEPRGSLPSVIPTTEALKILGVTEPKAEGSHNSMIERVNREDDGAGDASEKQLSIQREATKSTWSLAERILSKHQTLTGSNVLVAPNGATSHVSITSSGAEATVTRWRGSDRSTAGELDGGLVLTRLPQWKGAESAKVSVIRSTDEAEPVKIVLDKSADTWSNFMIRDEGDEAFPLMVERHQASFVVSAGSELGFLLPRQALQAQERTSGRDEPLAWHSNAEAGSGQVTDVHCDDLR